MSRLERNIIDLLLWYEMSITSSTVISVKEPAIDSRDDQLKELRRKRDVVYPSLLSIAQKQVDEIHEELQRINMVTLDLLSSKELKRRQSTDLYNSMTLHINRLNMEIDQSRSSLLCAQKEADTVRYAKEKTEKELCVLKQECKNTKEACSRSKDTLSALLKAKEKYDRKKEAAAMTMEALSHPYNMELLHRTLKLVDIIREEEAEEKEATKK